jgi:hypothetical protein
MMGIPEGAGCKNCDFIRWSDDYWNWFCDYPRDWWEVETVKTSDDPLPVPLRDPRCLAAYPCGAAVTITPLKGEEKVG